MTEGGSKTEILEHEDVIRCWLIEGHRDIHILSESPRCSIMEEVSSSRWSMSLRPRTFVLIG